MPWFRYKGICPGRFVRKSNIRPHKFEWDTDKSARNVEERGLSFELGKNLDFDEAIFEIDDRRDYGEVRLKAIGPIGDRLHVMVFTMRNDIARIISLRRANKREGRIYVRSRTKRD